jgi:hypothetical protein
MSPLPKEVSSEMFVDLTGEEFYATVAHARTLPNALNKLEPGRVHGRAASEVSSEIPVFDVIFSRAFTVREKFIKSNDSGLARFFDEPKEPINLTYENVYGVTITREKGSPLFEIQRKTQPGQRILLEAQTNTSYSWTIRNNLFWGIAVAPDSLWDMIQRHGLFVGRIKGNFYDNPWNIAPYEAFFAPSMPHKNTTILQMADVHTFPQNFERLQHHQPVAILEDDRVSPGEKQT